MDSNEFDTKKVLTEIVSSNEFFDQLLNSSDRLPPADIFSLGLTLYECCMADPLTGLYIMPSEGAIWRALREGNVDMMTGSVTRSHDLCIIIQKAFCPNPDPH